MRPKFKIIEIWCVIGKGRHLHMYMQSGTCRSVDGRLGRLSASAEMDRYRQMSDGISWDYWVCSRPFSGLLVLVGKGRVGRWGELDLSYH